MKKIMFNDKYGLTKAVLEGRKTQERKIIKMPDYDEEYLDTAFDWDFRESVIIDRYSNYKVGEIVAIAQSYKDCGYKIKQYETNRDEEFGFLYGCGVDEIPMKWPINGYNNKMFVKPELMPHQIRITNVHIERLQDISYEDCIKEGIRKDVRYSFIENVKQSDGDNLAFSCNFNSPREAYAALIDKVSGKGTWHSNPFVFVYDFELIK